MVSKVSVSEATIARIFMIVWFVTFLLGALFPFPFGFVFMAIAGLFVAGFATFAYVYGMEFAFGEKSQVDGGGSFFDFFRGRPKREGEDEGGMFDFLKGDKRE